MRGADGSDMAALLGVDTTSGALKLVVNTSTVSETLFSTVGERLDVCRHVTLLYVVALCFR